MDRESVNEIVNTLCSHMEKLETKTDALMQFMKEKKKVTDAQLAPYLEIAANASEVRWRAARVRIEYLLSAVEEAEESEKKQKPAKQETDATAIAPGVEKELAAESKKASKDQTSTNDNEAAKSEATDSANVDTSEQSKAQPESNTNVEASNTEDSQPEENHRTDDKNTVTAAQKDKKTKDQEAA